MMNAARILAFAIFLAIVWTVRKSVQGLFDIGGELPVLALLVAVLAGALLWEQRDRRAAGIPLHTWSSAAKELGPWYFAIAAIIIGAHLLR
jgi:hypothetical protein